MVAKTLEDYQKDDLSITDPTGREQMTTIINESGLYSVIFTSRKPIAKIFNKWVTTEVLPSIRKFGYYDPSRPVAAPLIDNEAYVDAQRLPAHERFMEEVARFNASNAHPFEKVFEGLLPKQALKAIAMGGDIQTAMTKGRRWIWLLSAGIDMRYVLWGQRTLTTGERAIRDAYRAADEPTRSAMLHQAGRIKPFPVLPRVEDED